MHEHPPSGSVVLPDGASDPRAGETALAVALGGVICPVPFVMSRAAMRIAAPGCTRAARVAYRVGQVTIALQAAGIATLAVVLLT